MVVDYGFHYSCLEGDKVEVKSKKKLKPNIIRVGDLVKINTPKLFVRCGYPLSLNDMKADIEKTLSKEIFRLFALAREDDSEFPEISLSDPKKQKAYNIIVHELAYIRLKKHNFGGADRKIFTEDYPKAKGQKATVSHIQIVKTGVYNKSYVSGNSYYEEYEYEPPCLTNQRTHKILTLSLFRPTIENANMIFTDDPIKIEAIHVEKIIKEEMRALTGKELKIAAEKGLLVRYKEDYYSPMDEHKNYNDICVMEKAAFGYYIGPADIDPEEWGAKQKVEADFDEGFMGVYTVDGIKYK
jgi:hypothetical protein